MPFKLNGERLIMGGEGKTLIKCLKYLDSLPFEQLVTAAELAAKVGMSEKWVKQIFQGNNHSEYTNLIRMSGTRTKIYGSKKTSAALRKELE